MPKSNTPLENQNTPKTYDAGDMYDIQSLAEYDMNWMHTAIERIRRDFLNLSKNLQENGVHPIYFDELQTVLGMYSYLAEERHSHHVEMAEQYKKEWKGQGGDK
ncbi:hypothetical protein [Acinetobacter haemolyticus]|uniref:hypothetical protein n=1 Tax=Acinetobacter haemolyticus TaxID=29430 RepID=UPI0009494D70|nr:hypothetical protein [Acinetobacter haemolyticus]APR71842.1 hypothetical protein AHTJS_16845 [Acinetobacter haemolyticus]